jgi:hypothetical protein
MRAVILSIPGDAGCLRAGELPDLGKVVLGVSP